MRGILQKIALLLLFFTLNGTAQADEAITIEVKAEKEIVTLLKDGSKEVTYVDAKSIIPNETIRYNILYHNHSQEIAESVVITNPIPSAVVYIDGSASGINTQVLFSIDGAKTFDFPENLIVSDEYGNTRLAQVYEYTHIQWRFKDVIQPQKEGAVYYMAKLK